MVFKGQTAGASYHVWAIANEVLEEHQTPIKIMHLDQIAFYCLLLPKLLWSGMPGIQDEPIFMLVDSNWNDIQPDTSIQLPRFPEAEYDPS